MTETQKLCGRYSVKGSSPSIVSTTKSLSFGWNTFFLQQVFVRARSIFVLIILIVSCHENNAFRISFLFIKQAVIKRL